MCNLVKGVREIIILIIKLLSSQYWSKSSKTTVKYEVVI